MLNENEISKLVENCKKGSERAFDRVYDVYGGVLFGITLRYAKDQLEAEDILQESFIKIFQNISSYQNKGSFEGWMKRIVINTALNKVAKNKSLNESNIEDSYDLQNNENIIAELSANELVEIINKLPDGYKTIFNLYAIDGFSHKEIAEKLNISEGTSKSQLSKAKAMLRKWLKQLDIVEK